MSILLLCILHTIKVIGMIRAAPEKEIEGMCMSSMVFLTNHTEVRAMQFSIRPKRFLADTGFRMFLIKGIPFLRQYTGLECPSDYLSSKRESCASVLPFPRPNRPLSLRTYIYGQIERPPYRNSSPFLKRETLLWCCKNNVKMAKFLIYL